MSSSNNNTSTKTTTNKLSKVQHMNNNTNSNNNTSKKNGQKKKSSQQQQHNKQPPPSSQQQPQQQQQKHEIIKTFTTSSSSSSNNNNSTTTFSCLICAQDQPYRTLYEHCQHNDVCYKCTLSLRKLMHDDHCCICKVLSNRVIIIPAAAAATTSSSSSSSLSFQDYQLNQLIPMNEKSFKGTYCANEAIRDHLEDLVALKCRVCVEKSSLSKSKTTTTGTEKEEKEETDYDAVFPSIHQLKNHVSTKHNLLYCQLCLENRKVFVKEQKLYTFAQLQHHQKFGETDGQFGKINGHPMCRFCNRRFYEDGDLFKHMYSAHETCFLCERSGVQFEFYKDYPLLEKHFEKCHFVCKESLCQEKHFVAFATEIELQTHTLKEHTAKFMKGTGKKGTKLNLDLFASGSSSGQVIENQMQERTRRDLRTGMVDASVIRFIGIAENNGYANDGINSGGVSASSKDYPTPKKASKTLKRKDGSSQVPSGSAEEENKIRYVAPAESSRSAFTPSRPLSAASNDSLKDRTALLIKRMKESVSLDKFNDFRTVSTDFQKGNMFATEYYAKFVRTFGENMANELYPLLIETMPERDTQKIDALNLARASYHSKELGKADEPQKDSRSTATKSSSAAAKEKKKSKKPAAVEFQPPANWGPVTPQTAQKPLKKKNKEEEFPTLSGAPNAKVGSSKDGPSIWFQSKGKEHEVVREEPSKVIPPTINGIVIMKKKKKSK